MNFSISSEDQDRTHLLEQGFPVPPPSLVTPLPPGQGRLTVPHFQTFSAIVNQISRTYRMTHDEALRHSRTNAQALRRDPVVMDALRSRMIPTAQLSWHLQPQDDTVEIEVAAAKAATEIIQDIPNRQQMLMHLLEASFYGRYAVQLAPEWDYSKGWRRLKIRDHAPVHGDKLVFKFSGEAGILVHAAYEGPTLLTDRGRAHMLTPEERESMIIHHFEPEDTDFMESEQASARFGVGIRGRIYWLWWQRQQVLSWLMDYLERVGAGGFTIYYYEAGNPKSQDEVREAAEKQFRNNAILFPRFMNGMTGGPGVERVEAGNGGAALLQQLVTGYYDQILRQYILGQTLSYTTGTTGLGSQVADLHATTLTRIIKYDAVCLQETLTRDLVTLIYRYTFPGVPVARWIFDVDKPNSSDFLAAAKAFYEMGGDLDMDELRSVLGLAKPKPGAAILSKLQSMQPAAVGPMPQGVPMTPDAGAGPVPQGVPMQ